MIGEILNNRYTVTDKIGSGAMGQVYKATDAQTGADVAVKLLPPQLAENEQYLLRFEREAEALRDLAHPNIVAFIDSFSEGSNHYLVMEYVAGGSLHDLLEKRGVLPVEEARQIAIDLTDALIRAHRIGIIHRDIKPENVLMDTDGTPRLTDFGVAGVATEEGGTRLTGTGLQIGTPYYMSPEAWQGDPQDEQSDIWSLGVLIYEMLMGTPPFEGSTAIIVMREVLQSPTPDMLKERADLPRGIYEIVRKALAKDKKQRYPNMRDLGADLERGHPAEPLRGTGMETEATSGGRSTGLLVAGALGLLIIVGIIAAVVLLGGGGESAENPTEADIADAGATSDDSAALEPIAAAGVPIYANADAATAVIGTLPPGQNAVALGSLNAGEWYRINFDGVEGWVQGGQVRLAAGNAGDIALIEPTPTPTATPTLAPLPTLESVEIASAQIYEFDFSDPAQFINSNWGFLQERWEIRDGEIVGAPPEDDSLPRATFFQPTFDFGAYEAQFRVLLEPGAILGVHVHSHDGGFDGVEMANDGITRYSDNLTVEDQAQFDVDADEWYTLVIRKAPDVYSFEIDGIMLFEDAPLSVFEGGLTFVISAVSEASVRIDDLTIIPLSSQTPDIAETNAEGETSSRDIPAAISEINIDANTDDWASIPATVDEEGENDLVRGDLAAIRAFRDSENLYVLIESYTDWSDAVQLDLDVDADGDFRQDHMINIEPQTGFGGVQIDNGTGNTQGESGQVSAAEISDNTLEAEIPLSAFPGFNEGFQFLRLRMMTGVCCGNDWLVSDIIQTIPVYAIEIGEAESDTDEQSAEAISPEDFAAGATLFDIVPNNTGIGYRADICGSNPLTICLEGTSNRIEIAELGAADIESGVSWSPDGTQFVLAGCHQSSCSYSDDIITTYDALTGELATFTLGGENQYFEWSPNDPIIAFVDNCELRVFDTRIRRSNTVWEPGNQVACVYEPIWSPSGQRIAFIDRARPDDAGSQRGDSIVRFNLSEGTISKVYQDTERNGIQRIVWTPDGQLGLVRENGDTYEIPPTCTFASAPCRATDLTPLSEDFPDSYDSSYYPQWAGIEVERPALERIVVNSSAPIYDVPGGTIVRDATNAEEAYTTGVEQDGWLRIITLDGFLGWVEGPSLRSIEPFPETDSPLMLYGCVDITGGDGLCVQAADASTAPVVRFENYGDMQLGTNSWSPDGTQIAFSIAAGDSDTFVANADGSGVRELLPTVDGDVANPTWSVNNQIALTVNGTIATVNPDGSGFEVVWSRTNLCADQAEWSPDGELILFSAGRCNGFANREILLYEIASNETFTLVSDPPGACGLEVRFVAFSPDGSQVAYASGECGYFLVDVADPTNRQEIVEFPVTWLSDAFPQWQGEVIFVENNVVPTSGLSIGDTVSIRTYPYTDLYSAAGGDESLGRCAVAIPSPITDITLVDGEEWVRITCRDLEGWTKSNFVESYEDDGTGANNNDADEDRANNVLDSFASSEENETDANDRASNVLDSFGDNVGNDATGANNVLGALGGSSPDFDTMSFISGEVTAISATDGTFTLNLTTDDLLAVGVRLGSNLYIEINGQTEPIVYLTIRGSSRADDDELVIYSGGNIDLQVGFNDADLGSAVDVFSASEGTAVKLYIPEFDTNSRFDDNSSDEDRADSVTNVFSSDSSDTTPIYVTIQFPSGCSPSRIDAGIPIVLQYGMGYGDEQSDAEVALNDSDYGISIDGVAVIAAEISRRVEWHGSQWGITNEFEWGTPAVGEYEIIASDRGQLRPCTLTIQ